MTDILSVARYILSCLGGSIEALRLQKLAYYAQAWHAAWTGERLFPESFEAWANGPVSPDLYQYHRRQYAASTADIPARYELTPRQRAVVDQIINFYGGMTPQQLTDLTHSEEPWIIARRQAGIVDGQPSNVEIPWESMRDYYRRIAAHSANPVTA